MQSNPLNSEKDMFEDVLTPVFNYAIAKVRYRALTKEATDVQVFFRLFIAVDTAPLPVIPKEGYTGKFFRYYMTALVILKASF